MSDKLYFEGTQKPCTQ